MDDHRDELSALLAAGINLEAAIVAAGREIRDRSKQAYGSHLLDARMCLVAALSHLVRAKDGIPGQAQQSSSDRLVLISTFIQGVGATEVLISEGQYAKAAAVLKQDYEILARLKEVRLGVAMPGKTPNVKHAPKGSQRFYGDLNDIAHPSNEHLLAEVLGRYDRGDVNGVSPIPVFNDRTARALYELHVFTLLQVTREALALYAEMYPDDLDAAFPALRVFQTAVRFAEEAGFTSEPDPDWTGPTLSTIK